MATPRLFFPLFLSLSFFSSLLSFFGLFVVPALSQSPSSSVLSLFFDFTFFLVSFFGFACLSVLSARSRALPAFLSGILFVLFACRHCLLPFFLPLSFFLSPFFCLLLLNFPASQFFPLLFSSLSVSCLLLCLPYFLFLFFL